MDATGGVGPHRARVGSVAPHSFMRIYLSVQRVNMKNFSD